MMASKLNNIDDLYKALEVINIKYEGNIKFKDIKGLSNTRVQFTLTVVDSHLKGGRLGLPHNSWTTRSGEPYKQRHIAAACWHVHGDFFDALFKINENIVVRAGTRRITAIEGNWEDWNIGSRIEPFAYSKACNCSIAIERDERLERVLMSSIA